MALRANFTRSYLWRYIIIAVLGIGWALYCAYDITLVYPKKLEQSEAYFGIEAEDDGDRNEKWKQVVADKNWKFVKGQYPTKKPEKYRTLIQQNYLMAAIALLLGVPNLFLYLTNSRAWVEVDGGDKINTSWGQSFSFSQITSLNKQRWSKKGIATVSYDEDGRNRLFALDDFKFDREPIGKMLQQIESTLEEDQIIGGEPEKEAASESDSDQDTDDAPTSNDDDSIDE